MNRRSKLQKDLARRAAIERSTAGMIPLVCGHWTSKETRDIYRVFSPPRGYAMCENDKCQGWRKIGSPPEDKPIEQDRLF